MPFIQMKDGSKATYEQGSFQATYKGSVYVMYDPDEAGTSIEIDERVKGEKTRDGFKVPKRKGVFYTFTKAKTIKINMEGGFLSYVEGAMHASHGTQVYKCMEEPMSCVSEEKSTAKFTPDGNIQVTTNLGRRALVFTLVKQ